MGPVQIGNKLVGDGQRCFIIAEIGINHNGDVETAKQLISAAALAGCDAVKFQKRTPEICVPKTQWAVPRETPWGTTSYLEYKRRIELDQAAYSDINDWCRTLGIVWFASCWDEPSVGFMEQFNPVCYKIASPCLTDLRLVRCIGEKGRPVILSTGMSSLDEIRRAVSLLDHKRLLVAQTTSAYPCQPQDVNLLAMRTLRAEFGCPTGYSGHESGVQITHAAVSLGASFVERHVTLDRGMWGTDHSLSVEPAELIGLVRDIRIIERALGDGVKGLRTSELGARQRLRRSA